MIDTQVTETIKDKNGNERKVEFPSYLYGIIEAIKYRVKAKYHGFIIMTGSVGDGKSSLSQGLGALWEHLHGDQLDIERIVWRTEDFISETDKEDNFGKVIIWDEAIQGATAKSIGMTNQGNLLKIALVTKRFKNHLYIFLVDEIEEYAWKLIKMCNAWIHVSAIGTDRGYWEAYTKKYKVRSIYLSKKYKYTKDFNIKHEPDARGRFRDYTNVFVDEAEYTKEKLNKTRSILTAKKSKRGRKKKNSEPEE